VITPIVKGRYAKHREHWNMMMDKAKATARVNAGEASPGGAEGEEASGSGLVTDDSLLEEDAEKDSDLISDVSSELLS
jgi:hypothetical protein